MPGRKQRAPATPRTISINGGLHKAPNALTKAEVVALGRFLDVARIGKVVRKRDKRWRPVPPQVWEPLAQAIAQEHGITVRQMLYGPSAYRFTIPRARFWRTLRAFERRGAPRYSLPAIAAITGHNHTSVMHLISAGTADMDYSKYLVRHERYERAAAVAAIRAKVPAEAKPNKRRSHVGIAYGEMVVLARAEGPTGETGRFWKCSCSCGSITVQSTRSLVQGKRACGLNHRATPLHMVTHLRTAFEAASG